MFVCFFLPTPKELHALFILKLSNYRESPCLVRVLTSKLSKCASEICFKPCSVLNPNSPWGKSLLVHRNPEIESARFFMEKKILFSSCLEQLWNTVPKLWLKLATAMLAGPFRSGHGVWFLFTVQILWRKERYLWFLPFKILIIRLI